MPSDDRRLSDSNQAWLGKVVDGRYQRARGDRPRRHGRRLPRRAPAHGQDRRDEGAASRSRERSGGRRSASSARPPRSSKLHHPHTVQVFDFGTAQRRAVPDHGVRARPRPRAHHHSATDRCRGRARRRCSRRSAARSQEAHELGIVHRDLKPENVLITRTAGGRDYAKVLDFGLAKLDAARARRRPTTDRQQIVGTPYFMSPEQIRGDDVDARSDIYSFGALMFELLTGAAPVHRLDRGRRADEAPDRRARRAVDARAEAGHRSARRSHLPQGAREGSERSAGRPRPSSPRRSRRSTPRPSATRPGPARASSQRARRGGCTSRPTSTRERSAAAPLRHRRVRARPQAPAALRRRSASSTLLVLGGVGGRARGS